MTSFTKSIHFPLPLLPPHLHPPTSPPSQHGFAVRERRDERWRRKGKNKKTIKIILKNNI
jgi:hypothetical protein